MTFALQNKVLDELEKDMVGLTMTDDLRSSIEGLTKRMRENLAEANEALKIEAADQYFDALFDVSEDILHFSSMLRDPKIDENLFMALVKAVSRLGRNNAALIEGFVDMCSFVHRGPKPRSTVSLW